MKPKVLFTIISFFLIQFTLLGQNMMEVRKEFKKKNIVSKEFKITKLDVKKVQKRYEEDENFDGNLTVFLINHKNKKLKSIEVSTDAYENDAEVFELINFDLFNVKKVLTTDIAHCACYCSTERYVWFITKSNKIVELPKIEEGDYDANGMKYANYVFSTEKPNQIQLVEFQDEYIKKGNYEPSNIRRKSKKILKTLYWNGKELSENDIKQKYIVNAKNGLNIREDYKLSAKKTGKLPYATIVEKVAETYKKLIINDNGKKVKGKWIKVKYKNSQLKETEGYIFDGYLKKYITTNAIKN